MKRRIILMLMFMMATGSAAYAVQAGAPKISAKEVRYDAGKVKQGKQVSHVFEISNTGTAQLVIQSVQPG